VITQLSLLVVKLPKVAPALVLVLLAHYKLFCDESLSSSSILFFFC
jgi:hypothetical protein